MRVKDYGWIIALLEKVKQVLIMQKARALQNVLDTNGHCFGRGSDSASSFHWAQV